MNIVSMKIFEIIKILLEVVDEEKKSRFLKTTFYLHNIIIKFF